MSLNTFVWSVCIFWAAVYAIRASRIGKSSDSLLPTSVEQSRAVRAGSSRLKINVKNFHLKVQSSVFNARHDSMIDFFERPSNHILRNVLTSFYDMGSVFGILGMLLGITVLALMCFQLLVSSFSTSHDARTRNLVKREESFASPTTQPSTFALNPIIPGVTVPLSHLPVLLLALFVAQCIHEAGHALAASIDSLSLHAVGASVTLLFPSAFVSLSSSLNTLPAAARMRIIAAGAWHNLLLWGVIFFASAARTKNIWQVGGWKDVKDSGLVVLGVEEDSPLVHHLFRGSLITALDDTLLGGHDVGPDAIWSRYLTDQDQHRSYGLGWCVKASFFFKQPKDCCKIAGLNFSAHPPAAQVSCFVPTHDSDPGRCIDPVPILAPSSSTSGDDGPPRCFSASDCERRDGDQKDEAMECIRPDESAQLLRIVVAPPLWEDHSANGSAEIKTKVILWGGPRKEVWEQVEVGTLAPRFSFLPLWFPDTISLFFEYLSTLSLSLFVFNLFALPFLDGSHFLSALLDYIGGSRGSLDSERDDEIELDIEYGSSLSTSPDHATFIASTASPPEPQTFLQSCVLSVHSLSAWWGRWRPGVRRRKAVIERSSRYATIVLMCAAVFGLTWIR